MKKMMLIGLVMLLASSVGFGATIVLTPSTASITPGQSFTIAVTMTGATNSKGASLGLFTSDTTGAFSVTGMTLGQFTDPQFVAGSTFPFVVGVEPTVDLGSTNGTALSGTINLGTIQLSSLPSTKQGSVTFDMLGDAFDANGGGMGAQFVPAIINVVPEPISMILLAIGGLFISRRK